MLKRRGKRRVGKKVSYTFIDPQSEVGLRLYPMVEQLVKRYHHHLLDDNDPDLQARFALAWNESWKPDADGVMTIGRCKRMTDLDRELAAYDFVISLDPTWWNDEA